MRVLVAYATRHGSTAGIADRIARTLRDEGLHAESLRTDQVATLEPYDAVVLGGAAYMFHWIKDARAFARKHREELEHRPVWLFSSGPLGTDKVDQEGHDVRDSSRPREFDDLARTLHPREERVFFGAWDPEVPAVGLGERVVRHLPATRDALPAGDFRDWDEIEAWACDIAVALTAPVATA